MADEMSWFQLTPTSIYFKLGSSFQLQFRRNSQKRERVKKYCFLYICLNCYLWKFDIISILRYGNVKSEIPRKNTRKRESNIFPSNGLFMLIYFQIVQTLTMYILYAAPTVMQPLTYKRKHSPEQQQNRFFHLCFTYWINFWTFIGNDNHATILNIDFSAHFHGNETLFRHSIGCSIDIHRRVAYAFGNSVCKKTHFDWHRKYYISALLLLLLLLGICVPFYQYHQITVKMPTTDCQKDLM